MKKVFIPNQNRNQITRKPKKSELTQSEIQQREILLIQEYVKIQNKCSNYSFADRIKISEMALTILRTNTAIIEDKIQYAYPVEDGMFFIYKDPAKKSEFKKLQFKNPTNDAGKTKTGAKKVRTTKREKITNPGKPDHS